MNVKLPIAAVAAVLMSSVSANAASLLAQSICGAGLDSLTAPTGRVSVKGDNDFCYGRAEAVAGTGFLGALAYTSTDKKLPSFGEARAGASEQYTFKINAPSGYTGGEIPLTVRFDFDGYVGGASDSNATNNSVRSAQLDLYYSINAGSPSGNGSTSQRIERDYIANEYDSFNGASFAFAGGSAIVSETLSVLPTSFTINMSLNARAVINSPDNGQVSALANGLSTFSFASEGPAFVLPDGFFVSSAEANIVNNFWIDPRLPTIAAVPLPASLPMLAFGGLALGALGRSRRKG